MKTATRQMTVAIPIKLKAELKKAAESQRLSLQDLVTNIVDEALGKGSGPEFLLASAAEKKTLQRVLAYLRGTKPDEEIREQFDFLLRQFERRA